ncbi:MAG TPA: amino acid adenylation domain-containing protein, partial [Longimicrobiaceae bacterium]|nr:amino acid adenylation domain-containing protein [Longimicrobiaceae bacterium]
MSIQAVLARLHGAGIRLRKRGDRLALSVDTATLDASLLAGLRAHRAALLEMAGSHGDGWWSPPPVVTPEMLSLVELTQAEIDRIVEGVPGGAANVQDIYPLAPLQEGILFHHLLSPEGDPYLLPSVFAFARREQLDAFVGALQAVMDRHDVLRTAVVWEGLPEPVQVVWRRAPLPVERVELDPAAGDAAIQLRERLDPRHYRIDVRRAPMLRACVAWDPHHDRWLLLLLHHHLVSDHTTLEVLQEEVQMHLLGQAERLPPALPFRNLVAQARLGVSREEHEAFFTGLLGDVDEPTAPFGLLDVQGDGTGIAEARLEVDAALARRLRERAHGLGVSAASVCHVAWAQVLARVSGRDDVVFGTVLFGRMQGGAGADRMVGPFINTLPVRIRVAEAGVEASVRRMHVLLADLLRHEHASLVLAQRCSRVHAPTPLFSALLNYRHGAGGEEARTAGAGPALEGIREIYSEERTNYPLTLTVDDLGGGFALTAQVHASVEPARVCAWMHTALAGLVEALEAAPERPVGDVEVLPEAERRQVVEEWNRTETAHPAGRSVHQLFEAQAERTPDALAVVFEDASLTYRELDRRADRLARHLLRLGVGPEVRVGLCLERGLELVVSTLGVLKSGGAYVPIDPTHPAERIAYVLEDSGVAVLLTQEGLRDALPVREGVAVVAVDREWEEPAAEPAVPPPSAGGVDHLAYVIYTSGSTGRPKGVQVEHRSLAAFLDAMRREPGISADDVLLAVTTLAFDIAGLELFLPLVAGARVVLAARETAIDPRLLAQALDEAGATVMQATPATWRMLLDAGWEGRPGLRALCGGEALGPALAERLLPRVGALWNLYGPTETTVWSTARRVERAAGAPPIGRPIAGTRVYVLDARGAPVPPGVPGELRIGGAGVARGYQGRPELTAERFLPDAYAPEPGARTYRTGDRVRWLASGELEYLGRIDQQVKVRGFRIEPGEVEARLLEHPGVRQTVVVAREDASGEWRLVAYVVGEAEADGMREHLRRSLPEYMVPGAFVALDRLPLTPNGKLDRGALPAPEYAAEERYVAPRTPVEEVLAGVWADVLRLERVGAHDSFFELGGHSLLAMRVVSRVQEVFGVELPLRALFEAPSVAALAGRVEELRRAELPALPPVVPTGRGGALPLSFAQERLWFLHRLDPESVFYNVPAALRLRGALDAPALERALGEIVRRHEALRTVFPERDGAPVQVIAPFGGFALPVEDLSSRGEAEREAEVRLRAREDAARPFDLSAGPLFRLRLLRLGEEEHVLLACMHHVVSDEWSMGVLFRELSALYAAYLEGGEPPLPELPVQYADYAVWQREQLRGEALGQQVAYWRERLAGAPALLELPTDRPRPAVQTYRGAHERVELPRELLER